MSSPREYVVAPARVVLPAAAVSTVELTELGPWERAWDRLVEWAPVPTPFLRSWWLNAVATAATRYVLVTSGDVLLGGLALQLRRRLGVPVYEMCAAGALCPDHLDVLAAPGHETDVQRAIRAWIERPGGRLLDLDGVVNQSLIAGVMTDAVVTASAVAPYELLPDHGDAYIASRSANLRRNYRRARNRLAEQDITHHRVAAPDVDAALDVFARLHRARPDRAALLAQLPRLRRAVLAGVAANEVQVDVLGGARTVAVEVSFRVGGALRLYQSARLLDTDLRDAGTLLHLEVVRTACDEGCHEVDLLRGAEEYKAKLASRTRPLYRVRIARGRRARLLVGAHRAAARARAGLGALRGVRR